MEKRFVDGKPDKVYFEKMDARKKNIKYAIIGVLFTAVIVWGVYMSFFYSVPCTDFGCFSKAMEDCKKATLINEEPEASWKYQVLGLEGQECKIYVKLLGAKKGELQMENLVNFDMLCYYPRGVGDYPEHDLSRCHGRLKEEFQSITIDRLHKLILENLKQIGGEFVPKGI